MKPDQKPAPFWCRSPFPLGRTDPKYRAEGAGVPMGMPVAPPVVQGDRPRGDPKSGEWRGVKFCLKWTLHWLGPSSALSHPFLGEGCPTTIDYRKKLILTSLLEDLVKAQQKAGTGLELRTKT